MNENSCGVPEERWVDWHLNRLPPETFQAMARHMESCAACRLAHSQWAEWLGASGESGTETDLQPSVRLRRALRFKIRRIGWAKRISRHSRRVAAVAAAAAIIAAAFALRGAITGMDGGGTDLALLEPMHYAKLHEPDGAVLMARPDTRVYTVVPAFAAEMPEGAGKRVVTVWVNGRTEEIFVLLEGLVPGSSRDVQAWGDIRQELMNLGILEFHQAQGHLYAHERRLPNVEELAFTIEPKGGSLQPTAPETARVRLADKTAAAGADGGKE